MNDHDTPQVVPLFTGKGLRPKDKSREKKEAGGRIKIEVKKVGLFKHYNWFGFLGGYNAKAPKGI